MFGEVAWGMEGYLIELGKAVWLRETYGGWGVKKIEEAFRGHKL